uniref:Uncharacterized protein n=1 Tax=Gadus morhua TaxID=8049 RepID=A0A8C5FUQ1_GADMO
MKVDEYIHEKGLINILIFFVVAPSICFPRRPTCHSKWIRVPFIPHPCQHLSVTPLFIFLNLCGVI